MQHVSEPALAALKGIRKAMEERTGKPVMPPQGITNDDKAALRQQDNEPDCLDD